MLAVNGKSSGHKRSVIRLFLRLSALLIDFKFSQFSQRKACCRKSLGLQILGINCLRKASLKPILHFWGRGLELPSMQSFFMSPETTFQFYTKLPFPTSGNATVPECPNVSITAKQLMKPTTSHPSSLYISPYFKFHVLFSCDLPATSRGHAICKIANRKGHRPSHPWLSRADFERRSFLAYFKSCWLRRCLSSLEFSCLTAWSIDFKARA